MRNEQEAKEMAGPVVSNYIIPYMIPVGFIMTGGKGAVRIDHNWSIENTTDGTFVKWQTSF